MTGARRHWHSVLAAVAAAGLAAGCAEPPRPRNAVLIVLDTLRADRLSAYGNPRITSPVLDALARKGILFEQVVTNAPWTLPAMVGLLAGDYPTARVFDGTLLVSLVEDLLRAGFETAAFTEGGFVSKHWGLDRGFTVFEDHEAIERPWRTGRLAKTPGERPAVGGIEHTFLAARAWLEQRGEEPFFLLVHTYEPHTPYRRRSFVESEAIEPGLLGPTFEIANAAMAKTDHPQKGSLGDTEFRYIRALYDGGVEESDRRVGELLETLAQGGLSHDTLVVVTSDHGEDLGDRVPPRPGSHGHGLYDETVLVPLIFYDPTRNYPARRIATQVRSIDTFPTILDLLGVPTPEGARGRSLLPLLEGGENEHRLAWSWIPSTGALRFRERMGVRTGSHKLILTPAQEPEMEPRIEWYDLGADAGERVNLEGSEPEREQVLRAALGMMRAVLSQDGLASFERTQSESEIESENESEKLLDDLRALGYVE